MAGLSGKEAVYNMSQVTGKNRGGIKFRMSEIKTGYESLWTDKGYVGKSDGKPL